MNNKLKLGVSALAGTLASVSAANAGDLAVTGGVTMTYSMDDGGNQVTGNNLGMNRDMKISGSGELDNGYSWSYYVMSTDDWGGKTSAGTTFTMDGIGVIDFSQGMGSWVSSLDDITPNAWEESWDGATTGPNKVSGINTGTLLRYKTNQDLPGGAVLKAAWNPSLAATHAGDKGTSAGDGNKGSGWEVGVDLAPVDGLTIQAAYSEAENQTSASWEDDSIEGVVAIKYAAGPITISAQQNYEDPNSSGIGTVEYYDTQAFGISFQVNDNLSVSYSEHRSEKYYGYLDVDADDGIANKPDVEQDSKGIGFAYNLGGATLKLKHNETDNENYISGTSDDSTSLGLGLAF